MKLYPKSEAPEGQRAFTEDEIRRGVWALYADVKCTVCGKEQTLAAAGGVGGPCVKCGGRTE